MNLHEFRLIPSAGHFGPGRYDRGAEFQNLAEIDLVDRYVLPLKDELDQEAVRYTMSPTRTAPGLAESDRLNLLEHILPVTCSMGALRPTVKIRPTYNSSALFAGDDVPKKLVRLVSEALGHWGALYVHGHKNTAPQPGQRGLTIEPFLINGPSAQEYAARLDRLGRDLGRAIADYCRQSNAAALFAVNLAPSRKAKAL